MIDFLKSKTDFDKVEEIVFDKLFINLGLNYLGKHKQKIRKESASEFISYEFKSKKMIQFILIVKNIFLEIMMIILISQTIQLKP